MDCQHCEKTFSDISQFEAHSLWHTERQAQLNRHPRKYTVGERPSSSLTDESSSSKSDGSEQQSSGSATSVESPRSPGARYMPATESVIPEFDFNFSKASPVIPAHIQPQPVIKNLEDLVARFPAFEVEQAADKVTRNRDYRCVDCEAVFSTQKDCDLHNQSRFCPGSAAVAYVLYRDASQPGGYRVDKKSLPFNGQKSSIKCSKCHLAFSNRLVKKVHERTHPTARIECLHCRKAFSTKSELDTHYEWHDDMEHRHHRDRCRRKLPGLKLQSNKTQKRLSKVGIADFGRKSVFLADDEMGAISEEGISEGPNPVVPFESTKELVAISLISVEDLERVHAPNGVFREIELTNRQPFNEVRKTHLNDALDALEGKSQTSSLHSTTSLDQSNPLDLSSPAGQTADDIKLPPSSLKKRASIRSLFRRTKSENQLESRLRKRSSTHRTFRRDSNKDVFSFDGRSMLKALLQRVSTAANKGDLKTVKKECDRLLGMKPPTLVPSENSLIPVQAFNFAEGTLVQDTAGNSRYITSDTVDEITSALRQTPVASLAKTKVSVLSSRAYLSSQEDDFPDAFWCYRQVLELLREHPMLFPDVIWHAAILSNLAQLSARLGKPEDEERYYLKALAISYNRYGRRDLNNTNFLTALAMTYEKNDQTTRAAEVYKRSLFARMEISGPGEIDTLMAMQELAAIYRKLGSLTVAKMLYEQCLGGFETQLSLDHKVTMLIIDRLCDIYIQLSAHEEALALYARALPHLRAVCEPGEELLQDWLSRFIQFTPNYDFPPEVEEYLTECRLSPDEQNLWVLQSLARVYMLAGLLNDASDLFEFVYNARRRIQGEQNPATLDALHGHCLALECQDRIDAAHIAYTNLMQLAIRKPVGEIKGGEGVDKIRAMNVRGRLIALQERKKILAGERDAWGLKVQGPCGTCNYKTALLCSECQVSRFCCEACRDLAARSHDRQCHPSVTLCQSKSITAVPNVPQRIEKHVIERLSKARMQAGGKAAIFRVASSFTFSYDPRNFATFRVKFNSRVDTYITFDRDADIRFTTIDPSAPVEMFETGTNPTTSANTPMGSDLDLPLTRQADGLKPSSSRASAEIVVCSTAQPSKWSTPLETESLLLPKGKDVYLLVAPGEKLFRGMVEKRQKTRSGDSQNLGALTVPNAMMMEYLQGLVLKGVERKRFAYLVEVES